MLRKERLRKESAQPRPGAPLNPEEPTAAGAPDPHDLSQGRSFLARCGWTLLGLLFVGLGAFGVILPGLPTTPFLVLAASCFVRSSPRLYSWVLANRVFGKPIRDFREGRGVPRRIKYTAIGTMWCFVAFAVLWAIPSRLWIPKAVVLTTAVIGTLYLRSLPNTEDFDQPCP